MQFQCEVRKVSAKKTASLDMVYQIVLETGDASVLALGALSPEALLDISVEPDA